MEPPLQSQPSAHTSGRKTFGRKLGAEFDKLVEAWLLWVTVGALTGVLVLSPSLSTSTDLVERPAPSAIEIERAVAQAEAEGIAAGAEIGSTRR